MYTFKGTLLTRGEKKVVGQNSKVLLNFTAMSDEGQYSQKLPFQAWGNEAETIERIPLNAPIEFSFKIKGREYQTRAGANALGVDLTVWKLTGVSANVPAQQGSVRQPAPQPQPPVSESDDLPF